MSTTRLSTKGQLIVPKDVRERHRWQAGTEFEILEREDGLLLRPVRRLRETTTEEVFGSLKYEGPTISIDEMNRAIEREARKQR